MPRVKGLTKKLLLSITGILIIATPLMPLFPTSGTVSAVTFTGQWVNENTIILGSASKHATYSLDSSTGNYVYSPPNPGEGLGSCSNTISINEVVEPADSQGTILVNHWVKDIDHIPHKGGGVIYHCAPEYGGAAQPITLTDTENAEYPPTTPSPSPTGLSCNLGITGFNLSSALNLLNPLNWLLCGIVQGMSSIVQSS